MAIDDQHLRVRRSLEEKLGVEEASYPMDRPIGGIDRRIGELAWKVVTAVIAGMVVMATIFAGVTAGLVLLLGP